MKRARSEYLWKQLRRGQYGGVDVVGFKRQKDGVLRGQTLRHFIDNYPDEAAAIAAHPECQTDNYDSKWTGPQVSLQHLPGENDPVAGGMYPDDI